MQCSSGPHRRTSGNNADVRRRYLDAIIEQLAAHNTRIQS
jgi:hypothetical protein